MTDEMLAMLRYPVREARLTFLRQNENKAFLATDGISGEKYLLRLHVPGASFAPAALFGAPSPEGETSLLSDIAAEGLVVVPQPVENDEGAFVTTLEDGTKATLLHWIEGESIDKAERTVALLRQIGRTVGQLRSFHARRAYDRPRYDRALVAKMARLLEDAQYARLDDMLGALRAIDRVMARLDDMPGETGLIHADLSPSNMVVMRDGRIALIDFGLSGYGHYIHEIGALYSHFTDERERALLVEGYGTPVDEEAAKAFLAMQVLLFIVTHRQGAAEWDWFPSALDRWCRELFRPIFS